MVIRLREQALRQLLAHRNLRQFDLARIVGVSDAAVAMWLSGQRRPSPKARQRLLSRLGVEFAELFVLNGGAWPRRGRPSGSNGAGRVA